MNRLKFLWSATLLLCSTSLWAIEVTTAVPQISHEGYNETIGSFTLTLRDDAFAGASPVNPIYIRFRLTQARGWSKTLVDQRYGHSPINLAIYANGNTELDPTIPATAVQLVRLIKGELEGWIKVTDSSSHWVLGDGGPTAPMQNQAVSITVGIRGSTSVRDDASTPSHGNEYADTGLLASTLLCANYQNTPNFGYGDVETIDLIAFNADTLGVETGDSPFPGDNTGIGFSNDYIVGRGANYFPCFEFYFESNNYDSLGYEIGLTRMDLINRNTYEGDIPALFLANSSDFDWRVGARLYVAQYGFNPTNLVYGNNYPYNYKPVIPTTHMTQTTLQVEAPSGGKWKVNPVIFNNEFVGFELILTEGYFLVNEQLKITGVKFQTRDEFEYNPLKLDAYGFYYNPLGGTTLEDLGPLRRTAATLSPGTIAYSKSIPFTGYDRGNWFYQTHITNLTGVPANFTALFYNPSSLLLGVLGNQVVPPHGLQTISIADAFGIEAVRKYSWVYVVSDQPLALTGVIEDFDHELLDIYPGMAELRQTMYGSHIPQDTSSWETTAYIVSSDPDVDASYYLKLPGSDETRIATLRFPSSTAIIRDNDFYGPNGRSTWFQINATAQAGIGILYYSGKHEPLLASTPLDIVPQAQWRFDHVGNPANGWWNGLAVMNPEPEDVPVDIRGLGQDGSLLVSKEIVIEGESNRVDTLENLLGYNGQMPISRVEVAVQSGYSNKILSFLLMGQANRMTTVAGNLPSAHELVLPHVPFLQDYWVGLALINTGPLQTQVTIQALFPSGQAGASRDMSLFPSEKRTFALADYFSETAGYSHYRITATRPISGYALTGNKLGTQLATILLEPAVP